MKKFFENYGGVTLGICACLVLIAMVSPVGAKVKDSLTNAVNKFNEGLVGGFKGAFGNGESSGSSNEYTITYTNEIIYDGFILDTPKTLENIASESVIKGSTYTLINPSNTTVSDKDGNYKYTYTFIGYSLNSNEGSKDTVTTNKITSVEVKNKDVNVYGYWYCEREEIKMPVKGDAITMDLGTTAAFGTNNTYRVLKMNGTQAFVVALYDYQMYTTFGDSGTYAGSTLDTLLNTTFYNALNDEAKAAIIPQVISQTYQTNSTTKPNSEYDFYLASSCNTFFGSSNTCYFTIDKTVEIGERYVYALDITDLAEYDNDMTADELKQLFNFQSSTFNSRELYVHPWLRSVATNFGTGYLWNVSSNGNTLESQGYYQIKVEYDGKINFYTPRPAFVIDLSKVDFTIN